MSNITRWLLSCSNKTEVGRYENGCDTYIFYIDPNIPFSILVSVSDGWSQRHLLIDVGSDLENYEIIMYSDEESPRLLKKSFAPVRSDAAKVDHFLNGIVDQLTFDKEIRTEMYDEIRPCIPWG